MLSSWLCISVESLFVSYPVAIGPHTLVTQSAFVLQSLHPVDMAQLDWQAS